MIDRHSALSINRQAQQIGISWEDRVYYRPKPVNVVDLELMRHIDQLHLEHPFMGARMLRGQLNQGRVHCWAQARWHVDEAYGY